MPLLEYYEEIASPALALAQIDVTRGVLERNRQVEVCESVERVVSDPSDHVDVVDVENKDAGLVSPQLTPASTLPGVADERSAESDSIVLCIAGRTPLDQADCATLVQLLEQRCLDACKQAVDRDQPREDKERLPRNSVV
jgi:hypothetical protein